MASLRSILGASVLATLAAATPQQFDFNDIATAPSVANGPAVSSYDQTASLLTAFSVVPVTAATTQSIAARGFSRRQSSSVIENSQANANFGVIGRTTTVPAGQINWLSGLGTHNVYGNLVNNGGLYISQTSWLRSRPAGGQTCDFVGHDANNGNLQNNAGGVIQVNDIGSASAPTYDWYLRSIQNAGTLQWCGRGDTGGSTYQLYSDDDAVNTGLISFEQAFDNMGAAFVWRNAVIGQKAPSNLYNNGTFRLLNVVYHNVQNIYGNGCWQLQKGAVLYLEDGTGVFQNPQPNPSFPNQNIIFQDSSAVLHLDTAVYSRNSNFGAQLYGFGSGNAIEFYQLIKTFGYNAGSGILNVQFAGGYQVNIMLGQGYDASKFQQKRNPQKYNTAGYNAIFYNGAAPSQSVPGTCGVSAPVCKDLGQFPPSPATTSRAVPTTTSAAPTTSIVVPSTSSAVPSSSSAAPITSSAAPTSSSAVPSSLSAASTSSSAVPSTSSIAPSTSSVAQSIPSAASSDSRPASTITSSPASTGSSGPSPTSGSDTATNTPYTPYYPALSTVTGEATTGTYTPDGPTACPSSIEAGTYCGFINPEDPCAPQPDGYGPVPTPDTASAFLAYQPFHSMASAAPTVIAATDGTQYTQTFRDHDGSSSAQSFIKLITQRSYDAPYCAAQCDKEPLCTAFNLYIERDPSVAPSTNASTAPTIWGRDCPNPASMTTYRCTLWGSELSADTATNKGQYREQFQIVVTGSNGWDKTNVTVPDQPSSPVSLTQPVNTATGSAVGSSAPSTSSAASTSAAATSAAASSSATVSSLSVPAGSVASSFGTSSPLPTGPSRSSTAAAPSSTKPSGPLDPRHPWKKGHNCHGKAIDAPNYYLGGHFFPGPFNPQVCSDYALTQNSVNRAAAQKQGRGSYLACQSFNAVYLHKNGKPHGTHCRLYTTSLDDGYATYSGGRDGQGNTFECRQSWTWELEVYDSGRL